MLKCYMIYRIIISFILLSVLLFVASKAVDIHDLPQVVLSFPKNVLIELLLISTIISILKAWRFLILLKNTDIKVRFLEVLKSFIAAQAVTPLPGGEAMRGILLHKEAGTNMLKTTGPVITQAYLELFSCAILTLIGSFVYQEFRIPALLFIIFLLVIAFILLKHNSLKVLQKKLSRFKKASLFLAKITKAQKDIKKSVYDKDSKLPDKVLVRVLAISLITNTLGGILIFLTAKAYGTDLGIVRSVFIYATSQVIQGVGGIVPAGIGFTESGLMGLLLFSGVAVTQSLAIVLIFRCVTLVFNTITGLIFFTVLYSRSLIFSKHVRLQE